VFASTSRATQINHLFKNKKKKKKKKEEEEEEEQQQQQQQQGFMLYFSHWESP
jgi:ribosomal protein L12E/L44/L45/RPP1/RPP2